MASFAPTIFPNAALARLRAGQVALGFGVSQLRTAATPLLARAAGFDWLAIDAEHGTLTLSEIGQLCVAALPLGVAPIVRIGANALDEGARALDNGAQGIIVPRVDTLAQARHVADAFCYAPQGRRNWGTVSAQFGFKPTASILEAQRALSGETLVIAMVETEEAVRNVDAIASVPGINTIFIGAVDLSLDMGMPSQFSQPRFQDAVRTVIRACLQHGKFMGMGGLYDQEMTSAYMRMGVRLIAGGSDQAFLLKAATERAAMLRAMDGAPATTSGAVPAAALMVPGRSSAATRANQAV